MQRRAAAVYFVLLVVLGAGAYAFMQVGMAEPDVRLDGQTYSEGDELTVDGVTYTVSTISEEEDAEGETTYSGELNASGEETIDLEEGSNVTLGGVEHFAHFTPEGEVQILSADEHYDSYAEELDRVDAYHERKAGFWGVTILSFLGGIVLLSAAYMPVRG